MIKSPFKSKTIFRMTSEVIDGKPVVLMGPDTDHLQRFVQDGDELKLAPKTYAELKLLCNLGFTNEKQEVVWAQVGDPDLTELSTGDVIGRHTIKDLKGTTTEYLVFWEKLSGSKGDYMKRHKMPVEAIKVIAEMKTVEAIKVLAEMKTVEEKQVEAGVVHA